MLTTHLHAGFPQLYAVVGGCGACYHGYDLPSNMISHQLRTGMHMFMLPKTS